MVARASSEVGNEGRTPVHVDSHERDRQIIFHDVW
jgi:hypothetical protein